MKNLTIKGAQSYKTIVEILNKVFGISVKAFAHGYKDIASDKRAVFFCLSERWQGGGWHSPKKGNKWLNIPDSNGKAFTQVELNKTNDFFAKSFEKDKVAKKEHAVFMLKKDPKTNVYRYYFYGVFTARLVDKNAGICIYIRKNTVLKITDWNCNTAEATTGKPCKKPVKK